MCDRSREANKAVLPNLWRLFSRGAPPTRIWVHPQLAPASTRDGIMKSLQGHFLVASPKLADENFYKTVVLMIKHDDEGALGLILNRPTASTVGEVWKMISEDDEQVDCAAPIYVGGPVPGPPVALHRLKDAAEAEVLPGIFFAAHKEQLKQLISQDDKPYRFFLGYAGWAGGQLESELKAGGWLTSKAKRSLVFSKSEELWEEVVRTIGQGIVQKTFKVKHVPDDPTLN
jgi:putative transcriptional regulator